MDNLISQLEKLEGKLEGDLKYDYITKSIYSTDASVYKEVPAAVAWPKGAEDIRKLLQFAKSEKSFITMRAGGTSLAGQVVSSGIIADVSKYMNNIIEINSIERWVRIEPGVVLDELNIKLKEYGLFFGPETSTSNRCNLGGMVGNNACGSHSLVYGSTRDHVIELKALLSDGSEVLFGPLSKESFNSKCSQNDLEGEIYRNTRTIFTEKVNREKIREGYPDRKIPRRNTGYALDILLNTEPFTNSSVIPFNFSALIAGSEGTLMFMTEIKLNLVPLPPKEKALICVHCHTLLNHCWQI